MRPCLPVLGHSQPRLAPRATLSLASPEFKTSWQLVGKLEIGAQETPRPPVGPLRTSVVDLKRAINRTSLLRGQVPFVEVAFKAMWKIHPARQMQVLLLEGTA